MLELFLFRAVNVTYIIFLRVYTFIQINRSIFR